MDYIAQPKDYWIAQGVISITLNALGNPNRTQGMVASDAVILCYIEGVEGLGYDNGHRFKTWPLIISPTYFNTNSAKYVYVAIPRTSSVGTQAVVVFPSEKLDIYGKNAEDEQVGAIDYYYIWLQGTISSSGPYGDTNRVWSEQIDFGKKGTDEDLYDDTETEWYQYSKVSEIVTFLKNITMKAGATFYNLYLGYKELTGVATATTSEDYVDSETLVATPSYIHANYLRKNVEDTAEEQIGFLKGLWIGAKNLYEITARGVAKFKSLFVDDITAQRMQVEDMQSSNYTGDGIADTGWQLTKDYNGHSKLTVDELYVRMKAVFESLEVKKELVSGGNQVQSCAASIISRVDYLDGNKNILGYDEYKVPFTLRNAIVMLAKGQNPFGSYSRTRRVRLQLTAADRQNVRYVRCYFLAKEGDRKIQNWWRVADPNDNSTGNDLARCQTFNLASDSISERDTYFGTNTQKQGNIFWWRKLAGVSTTPVTIDGKQYHYFDVYCNPTAEAATPYSYSGAMEGSDIPAPGDEVSQWGNDNNIDRMNLIVQEVNGQDAAIKMYEGINQFSMETGLYGNPLKIRFAPKTGCKVHTTKWEVVTETFIAPIPVECGNWSDITPVQGQRTARYYEIYQHNGGSWLCVASNGGTFKVIEAFSTYAVGDTITQTAYDALTVNQQMCCARVSFGTTTDEPSTTSAAWRQYAAKGEKGDEGNGVETVYIRTRDNYAPVIGDEDDPIGEDSNGKEYLDDGYLPLAYSPTMGVEKTVAYYDSMRAILGDEYGECTAEPLGVNSTYKYEWEIKRTKGAPSAVTGVRVWNAYAGTLTLHNNHADDGWMITADPANVIITQNMVTASNFTTATVGFTAKKGSVSATISSIGTPSSTEFNVAKGTGDNVKKVIVSSPKTYVPTGETSAVYYSEGSFVVTVNVTDPDSGSTVVFPVTVLCYANLLGTFKTTIEGDVETSVAEKITYGYDHETGAVGSLEAIGKYIKSSEENISVLAKKVSDGKNLFSLTSGWEGTDGASASYDEKNFGVRNSTDNLYSPVVLGVEGTVYCFSVYIASGYYQSGNPGYCYGQSYTHISDLDTYGTYVAVSFIEVPGDTITIGSTTYQRYYFQIPGSVVKERYFTIYNDGGYWFFCPQLEVGTLPTAFSAGSIETSSQIKQTADEIVLKVEETGIDIVERRISLKADRTVFLDNSDKPMVAIQMYQAAGDDVARPSIVFYDNGGVEGGNATYVLNWKGLLKTSDAFAPQSWEIVELSIVAFQTTDKVPAYRIYEGPPEPDGIVGDIPTTNRYRYMSQWEIVNGVKVYYPSPEGEASNEHVYDASTLDSSNLPTGHLLPDGWYFGPVKKIEAYKHIRKAYYYNDGLALSDHGDLFELTIIVNLSDTPFGSIHNYSYSMQVTDNNGNDYSQQAVVNRTYDGVTRKYLDLSEIISI